MVNKYDIDLSAESYIKNIMRLTNQVWKLIPMRENAEDYIKQVDTVIIEISGLAEIFPKIPLFLQMLSKLEGLKQQENIEFSLYRKTIFEIINLLQEVKHYA